MRSLMQSSPRGNRCLEAALEYTSRGWHVFPVPPGTKRSYLSAEFSGGRKWGASNKPRIIRRCFQKYPRANIGICTGTVSGFFVLEADTEAGHAVDGIASLERLQAEHGALPKTLQVVSPSGSLHYYFRQPGIPVRNSASAIARGVDVRGDGGMVLAPPSVKPGVGTYHWINHRPLAEAPRWLLTLIMRQPESISHQATALVRKPASSIHSVEGHNVRAALEVIAQGCEDEGHCPYQLWFEVACALHATFGDAGFEIFLDFSAMAPGFEDEKSCAAKWRSCRKVKTFTIATVFHYAEKYQPRWRAVYQARQLARVAGLLRTA